MKARALIAESGERFARDVAEHQLTVLHDDGLYRHVRLAKPKSSFYWFDLVTWPGVLAINGDMGGYVFSRERDMVPFFRAKSGWNSGTINPQYWAEKLTAHDGVKSYSDEKFRQIVVEEFVDAVKSGKAPAGLGRAVRDELLDTYLISDEDSAVRAVADFDYKGFRFSEAWEWSLREYTHQFLWCCHAIQWGIEQYDKARVAVTS